MNASTPAASLHERILGGGYERLPAGVREFHRLQGRFRIAGIAEVHGPATLLAALLARVLGIPRRDGKVPLTFHLAAAPDEERWRREFADRVLATTLACRDGRLVEQLGPVRLGFTLFPSAKGLRIELVAMQFFALPCPAWIRPTITGFESGESGRLEFDVEVRVPLAGRVVKYTGWLDLATLEPDP